MPKRRRTVVKSKHAQIAQKRKKIFISIATILIVGGVVGLCVWLLTADQFELKQVAVTGLETLPEESFSTEAKDYLNQSAFVVLSKRNKFLFNKHELEEKIAQISPKISSVEVSEEGEEVRVRLEERQPFAQWCGADRCLIVDETGFAFEESPEIIGYSYMTFTTDNPPEIGKMYPSSMPFDSILALLDGVRSLNITPLRYHEESNTSLVEVETDNRTGISGELKLDPQHWETSLSNLSLLLSNGTLQEIRSSEGGGQQFAYIDLRFGNKVFYSFHPDTSFAKQSEKIEETDEVEDIEVVEDEAENTEIE